MSPVIAVTDTAVGDDGLERALAEETGAEYRRAEDLGAALDGADVVFTNFAPLGAGELGRLAADAVVIRYGVGVDNVDLAAAAGAGVRVCNVPDYGANVVADHAVMLAAMLVRRVRDFDAALHRGEEPDPGDFGPIPSLESRTVGLVGAGRIAQLTAARFHAFGCRTVAFDPFADAGDLAGRRSSSSPGSGCWTAATSSRSTRRSPTTPTTCSTTPRSPRCVAACTSSTRPAARSSTPTRSSGRWTRASSPAPRST